MPKITAVIINQENVKKLVESFGVWMMKQQEEIKSLTPFDVHMMLKYVLECHESFIHDEVLSNDDIKEINDLESILKHLISSDMIH